MDTNLPDIQHSSPNHQLPIHRVGINNLKLPINIRQFAGGSQHTVADIDIYVDLPSHVKGTHMSRLAIGAQKFMSQRLDSQVLETISEHIRVKCEAKTAQVIYSFPYFITKNAPNSKEPGLVHCQVIFDVTTWACEDPSENVKGYNSSFKMTVETTTTSCCPCSKEISEAGAHNQRSKIKITCQPTNFIWIEQLVQAAEECSSCEIYSVLKRIDEKYVTEKAYNNPMFVEDMVRALFYQLDSIPDIGSFKIEVRNEESIHTHNAFAMIQK